MLNTCRRTWEQWRQSRYQHQQARDWLVLRQRDEDSTAAFHLYLVNRYVLQVRKRERLACRLVVHDVKHTLLEHFTRAGFEVARRTHRWVETCPLCHGKGWDRTGKSCTRCGESGIDGVHFFTYRTYRIACHPFAWHVPMVRRPLPPELTQGWIAPFSAPPPSRYEIGPHEALFSYLVLRQYLIARGYDAPVEMGVRFRDVLTALIPRPRPTAAPGLEGVR